VTTRRRHASHSSITATQIAGRRYQRPSRRTTPEISQPEQVEQPLARNRHDVAATVHEGWKLQDVLAAQARINASVDEAERRRTWLVTRRAARAETAAKYSGTVRQYRHHGGGIA
jgi:hypothetical protein